MLDLPVREIPSITFFSLSQEEMVNVPANLEDHFAKSKAMPGIRNSYYFGLISCKTYLTNSQVKIESFFDLNSTNH